MIWENRATRRPLSPTGRFFSVRTGVFTASRRIDSYEPKLRNELLFQNWPGHFTGFDFAGGGSGARSGLAAVARPEPRFGLERNRHSANFSGQGAEVSLAHTGGAGLVESGGGCGPGLPD